MMYRKATMDDADMLMRWRNDPLTVANFRSSRPVTRDEHRAWLRRRLAIGDPTFVVFDDDHNPPIGTVHLDTRVDGFNVSVTVAPDARGKGYGGKMLKLICDDWPKAALYTEIKDDNAASMKSFGAAGFTQTGKYGPWTHWMRPPLP